ERRRNPLAKKHGVAAALVRWHRGARRVCTLEHRQAGHIRDAGNERLRVLAGVTPYRPAEKALGNVARERRVASVIDEVAVERELHAKNGVINAISMRDHNVKLDEVLEHGTGRVEEMA